MPVTPGERYELALSFLGVPPAVSVAFLDKAGALRTTVPVSTRVDFPAGASALRIAPAMAPTLGPGETTWVDDVGLW